MFPSVSGWVRGGSSSMQGYSDLYVSCLVKGVKLGPSFFASITSRLYEFLWIA